MRVIAERMVRAVITVLVVSFIMFSLLFMIGDPAAMILAEGSPQDHQRLREQMGLDDPFLVQYTRWLSNAVRGDFGRSLYLRSPVWPLVLARVPVTLTLTGLALFLSVAIAVPAGIVSAVRRYSLFDQAVTVLVLLGQSMPVFWTGIVLMLIFAVNLRWVPSSGWGTWQQAVLPVVSLGAYQAPLFLRLVRSSLLEVLGLDYVRTARAKGLSERLIIYKHALKNAAIPVVSVFGIQFALLMGGAVITETVFAIPGLGRLMVRSIMQVDQTTVLATSFFLALVIVAVNLTVDFCYVALDPRIRYD